MPFTRSSLDACYRRNVEYYRGYLYCCRARILFMSAARTKGTNKIRGRIDIDGNECRANGPLIIRVEFRQLAMRPADGIYRRYYFPSYARRPHTFSLNRPQKFNYRRRDPRESKATADDATQNSPEKRAK